MQSVSSRIWTRMAVFISYGDNDYTKGTWYYFHESYYRLVKIKNILFYNILSFYI